jgi:CheY-like chemotaxis protein
MLDVEASILVLRRLKELGVQFSIDDFGTGYSSLSYLKRLPIDKIKIDQTFIRNITTDPEDAAISRAIISLSHSLKLGVIAEGVERREQLEFLSARACDQAQGYYFSRPVPAAEMERILLHPPWSDWSSRRRKDGATTLLLVDDDPNVVNALSRLLHKDEYRILPATDCRRAFELLATNDVDVVVADYCMPDMDGVEFLRRARSLYPATVRIMLTAVPEWKTAAAAINEGSVYKFITKPWDDAKLSEEIREAARFARRQEIPQPAADGTAPTAAASE